MRATLFPADELALSQGPMYTEEPRGGPLVVLIDLTPRHKDREYRLQIWSRASDSFSERNSKKPNY